MASRKGLPCRLLFWADIYFGHGGNLQNESTSYNIGTLQGIYRPPSNPPSETTERFPVRRQWLAYVHVSGQTSGQLLF